MSLRQKPFLFYLVDTPTGLCYYMDSGGNVQKAPISFGIGPDGIDVSIADPDGWMNSELGFLRNAHYYGINRSFTVPQKLVDDAAFIARYVINRGRGIEVPLSMVIFKYNDDPAPGEPLYKIYYNGQLDLPNYKDRAGEGVSVNMMEGGIMQLLKAYENKVFEIPMDGSISENLKVNMDGMLFEDTFNYSVVGIKGTTAGAATLPCVFINNEGDNAGIIHNDPTYDTIVGSPFAGTYFQQSQNHLFVSSRKVSIRIKGSIIFSSSVPGKNIEFALYTATSNTVNIGTFPGESHVTGLIPTMAGVSILVQGQQVLTFDQVITLDANERLFIMMSTLNGSDTNWSLVGGSFTMTFASQFADTQPWCITWFDAFRLLVKYICQEASIAGQVFNYGFSSKLLQDNLNLVLTSGDALRASGDPNYQRFYNAVQNNPNFPNINLIYSFGPVLKTTLADCFNSVNAILNASLSTQILPGQNETLFVESKGYVFDSSVVNLDNGEVIDFETAPALDLYFTLLKIGYEEQQYDQKAGKYAWNTKAEWQTPLKSIPTKIFEVVSKYIAEPYVIERLRSGIDDTSITRNSNDNQVFVINTDPTTAIPDTYEASFDSANVFPANPDQAGNSNIKLTVHELLQSINLPVINGSYLSFSNNASIFLFNQAALSAHTFNVHVTITGNLLGFVANALTGLPADSTTINLVVNGVIIQSWTTTATGTSTPINIAYTTSGAFSYKDSIYLTCSTSIHGTADLDTCTLSVEDGSNYLTAIGSSIEVAPGIPFQLLALPQVTARPDINSLPSISYGFQYFIFNSILINHNFDVSMNVNGLLRGGGSDIAGWDVYLNGVPLHSSTFPGTPGVSNWSDALAFNHDFEDGDILFMVASASNLSVWITDALLQLTSTQILARNLKRVQYDNISGVPLLLGNIPGTAIPITTGPGAPYNIEDVTPGRMVRRWGNYIRSILFDQIPGVLAFSTSSKNQNLTTTYQGVTIIENADIHISDFDAPLFFPRWITYKTRVQDTFAAIMTGAANGHARNTFNNVPFFGFPWELKQKAALNEMQDWKMLASPINDLTQLINLDITGLNFLNMAPNSIFCSFLSPIAFVPMGQVLPAKYHTPSRNLFWFNEQINKWINRNNYWQPRQATDQTILRFITRDLATATLNLYSCGAKLLTAIPMTEIMSPAVLTSAGYHLWEVTVDTSMLIQGGYYMTAVGGDNISTLISEGVYIKADWPKTLLIEYTSGKTRQSMVFTGGYVGSIRFQGWYDNTFKQKYKGAFYTDTRQSIEVLNAFPYETASLWCGLDDGIPDYMFKKIARIMLLDGVMIEGEGFSIDEGAEWEETIIPGNPKKYVKIDIRPTDNADGVSAIAGGADDDTSMLISLDASAFGPNAGNMGSPDPDIITVTINP